MENRKNEIKKYFSLSYDIDRYKSPIFLRIYENIDFDQIRNNGYNGYYSKTIKNSGISNVEELFFIKITEYHIEFGYEIDREDPIELKEINDDGNVIEKKHTIETSSGTTWIFTIDKNNNIELNHIRWIG